MIGTEEAALIIGKNVELICFAQYSIYIHFQDGIVLTVESGLEHIHNETRKLYNLSSPPGESSLPTILEKVITSASVEPNGDFQLILSNGDRLRVYKSPSYESYRLKIAGEELIA